MEYQDGLPVGGVARLTGKTASTIRYYERIGLIPAPPRTAGQRRYPPAVIRTLAIIDAARQAGLTLSEVLILQRAPAAGTTPGGRLREIAARKVPELQARIDQARQALAMLEAAAACDCPALEDCPLISQPS